MGKVALIPIMLVALVGLAYVAVSSASSTLIHIDSTTGRDASGGVIKVRIWGANKGQKGDLVTNGGVAGIGRFVASGAISERGKVVVYRTVKGPFITLRNVTIGKKGTITFLVKINTDANTSRWTITSGTKAYRGLYGKGVETENADFTVSTLTGTVSH
jgi:hypothetical protein